MYEVQQTRWDRIIRRVSASIGPGSRVSETLSELFPVLDVERVPGELLMLGGTGLAFGGGQIAAVAGERPTAILFNPADSNQLVTITRVHVAFSITGAVRWGIGLSARGTAISTQVFRDSRRVLPALPVAQVRQESAVAFAPGTNQVTLLADTPFILEDDNSVAVLAPGTGFEIGSNIELNTIFYAFSWRERPAEEAELSL